jgi:hypothetical protein
MILSDLARRSGFAKAANGSHPRIKSEGMLFGIMREKLDFLAANPDIPDIRIFLRIDHG